MKYLSVCSGIEAATLAWHPLGWEAFAYSEIEKFPSQVLSHHYPNTPNFGDMTEFQEWPDATIDVLVGGTPCQSFSIAGLRKGLDDPRGNLSLTFGAIAAKYRPKWLVWENVFGVLSSNGGTDFASFLGLITGQSIKVPDGGWKNSGIIAGYKNAYGVAWRVLDAQYFGVPQRRRRIIIVGHLGDWRAAAAVLFERHSLQGNPAPSRQKGERIAATVTAGPPFSRTGNERLETDAIISVPSWQAEIASTLDTFYGEKMGLEDQHVFNQKGSRFVLGNKSHVFKIRGGCEGGGKGYLGSDELSFTVTTSDAQMLHFGKQIRRLTPRECERLQGFNDDYTRIPKRHLKHKPKTKHFAKYPDLYDENEDGTWTRYVADGPRYKALGNSMAVPVMHWIGERIQAVLDIQKLQVAG